MSYVVSYDPSMPYELDRRWSTQAAQMRTLTDELSSASTGGLPPAARGAAQAFLQMWENTAAKARVASEVYADELRETGTSYTNLDAEIARRMDALGSNAG